MEREKRERCSFIALFSPSFFFNLLQQKTPISAFPPVL